ncbi:MULTISPECIES: universal stress protein [unclassified Modestobacter]|uniref:universal stress protein n=1 Tax=unclassified Modestobacter TaxID=2643866 RepID=UPI0022AA714A|nr:MULTISPECIES: universal stress protein [unclassified Modestobacter]MCZ2812075.1 universal stress protein [Modestobacter sp. VKM Ac-2979]MCZ2843799.1 universal stress protein [Modestobacter sp. VKM Ac-2980]MCZ2849755.1 universal stress protein [Modestobacter sp. VKM Ac-2978]
MDAQTADDPQLDGRPVVGGVDGDPLARAAVRVGAREASARGVALELVLALPWSEADVVPAPEGFDVLLAMRIAAALALEDAASGARAEVPGLQVRTRIEVGHPVDLLAAESTRAQLLCLGSTGRGRLTDLILGSTAAALVHQSHCPVLLVPRTPPWSTRSRTGVVAGLAGDELDPAVAAFAVSAAAARGCELVAVRAWSRSLPGAVRLSLPLVDADAAQRRAEADLADSLVEATAAHLEVVVRQVAEHGPAAQLLLGAALSAELVVVGHPHRRLGGLGSVAAAVVHRAGCPVAVVPSPDHPADLPS